MTAPGEWTDATPRAGFELRTLEITGGSPQLQAMVNDSLSYAWAGRSAGGNYRETLRAGIEAGKAGYLAEIAEADDTQTAFSSSYNRERSMRVEPLFNQGGILTLAVHHYLYLGGAHGMYGSSYYNFVDSPARTLTYEDIVAPDDRRAELTRMITAAIDPDRLFEPDEPVEPTNNVALTEGGLLFSYAPYEIGPYAAGQIEVTLPYDSLQAYDLLRPEIIRVLEL